MPSKNSFIQLLLTFVFLVFVVSSCSKSELDTQPQQPVVTIDSSEYNGRLKVEVRNVNNGIEPNAIVYLYPSYEDLLNNLSLNYIYTNNNGLVDFGYLLQGNYYLLARNLSGTIARDTAVVQVNSHRETLRIMRLSY